MELMVVTIQFSGSQNAHCFSWKCTSCYKDSNIVGNQQFLLKRENTISRVRTVSRTKRHKGIFDKKERFWRCNILFGHHACIHQLIRVSDADQGCDASIAIWKPVSNQQSPYTVPLSFFTMTVGVKI